MRFGRFYGEGLGRVRGKGMRKKEGKERKEGVYEYGVTGASGGRSKEPARIEDRIEWKGFVGGGAARRAQVC